MIGWWVLRLTHNNTLGDSDLRQGIAGLCDSDLAG